MRYKTPLLLAAVALTLGCGSGDEYEPKQTKKIPEAQIAAGEERTLAPLALGNQWVYTLQQGSAVAEVTMKVTDVQQTGNNEIEATISVFQSGAQDVVVDQTMVWRVNDTGVYQVTTGTDTVYDPAQLLLPFPLDESKTFEHEGTGGRPGYLPGPYTSTLKYIGPQEVDTESGRMSAIAIMSSTKWETDTGTVVSNTITWWRPDIGFIRQTQDIRSPERNVASVLKLKSHSFPRSSQ